MMSETTWWKDSDASCLTQAERLNYMRFLSHFRSVHRGSFFSEMKTTSVRPWVARTV